MVKSVSDDLFLARTLALAKKGRGHTSPNPLVGCVIVKNNRVLAEGYHHRLGGAHAEIEALAAAKKHGVSVRGATLYVNLEPCSYQGRQPPCAPALVAAGITRVVFCTIDPNPRVAGKGAALLRQSSIEVSSGHLEAEARALNESFFTYHETKRPFIALKYAASLDGKIATYTGDSKWITNEASRAYARSLRGIYQAILVGIGTVLTDDPHLGSRQKNTTDPLRIILDSSLRIPLSSQVLRDNNVLIVTTHLASKTKLAALKKRGFSVVSFRGKTIPIPALLKVLKEREIISVLVEGGGTVLGSFIDQGLVDKVYIFQAPLIVGGVGAISAVGGRGAKTIKSSLYLQRVERHAIGSDLLTIGYLRA